MRSSDRSFARVQLVLASVALGSFMVAIAHGAWAISAVRPCVFALVAQIAINLATLWSRRSHGSIIAVRSIVVAKDDPADPTTTVRCHGCDTMLVGLLRLPLTDTSKCPRCGSVALELLEL
jgi:uncharacterized paraquat-inducible protein A